MSLKTSGVEFPGSTAIIPQTKEQVGGEIKKIVIENSRYFFTRKDCGKKDDYTICPALKSDRVTCCAQNFSDGKRLTIGVACWPAIKAILNNGNGHHSNFHQ